MAMRHGRFSGGALSARSSRWLAAAFVLLASPAGAGDHGKVLAPLLPKYRQECGACHVAYPPEMLAAASWKRLLGNLPNHFGTDATLDAGSTRELSDWLAGHAPPGVPAPQDRITRSRWFVRKHDEVSSTVWKRSAVNSPANCSACHTQADQGDFNEHRVRIPR